MNVEDIARFVTVVLPQIMRFATSQKCLAPLVRNRRTSTFHEKFPKIFANLTEAFTKLCSRGADKQKPIKEDRPILP